MTTFAKMLVGCIATISIAVTVGGSAAATGRTTTSGARVRYLPGPIEALALDGGRIAYDVGATTGRPSNKVFVWNTRTSKTTKVSGKHTARADNAGSGVLQLAIAGSRVAWLVNKGGNTEDHDDLFASSLVKPKEQNVASEVRYGDNCAGRRQCAGKWLGGLVGSGNLIALNRWTTDYNGSIADGELDVLSGTKTWQLAVGADTVEAASADGGRVAVLRLNGTIALYSPGRNLRTVTPSSASEVALSGQNLVVLTKTETLELYNTKTGALRKTLHVHGVGHGYAPRNLDVHGNIAIYIIGSLHAVNLTSGKDRVVGKLGGGQQIGTARIGGAGLVYSNDRSAPTGTLVFLPLKRVTAAVGR